MNSFSQSTTVVISQVYGGGGSAAGTFKSDFVELHNISTVSQDISGFKLIYGSSTGNLGTGTSIFTFPLSSIIPAGGYVLVANAAGAGIANLTPSADYTFTLALSGTTGKVAFGNASLVGGTTYAAQQATGNVIDFVGYGTANESETSPTGALSTTTAAIRKTNGCTETNNNSTDFAVATVTSPRNSASPVNICNSSAPTFSTSTATLTINGSVGTASAAQSFVLSAANLTPAIANATITPSAGVEVSLDNVTFSSMPITLAYTSGTIPASPATNIYVRVNTATAGAFTGTATVSGGGATNAVVNVNGTVSQNFYSKPTGILNLLTSWGVNLDGTGTEPTNFTNPNQIFNIVNRTSTTLGSNVDISGTGSKLIIGDGVSPIVVTTSPTDPLGATTLVDLKANSTLEIGTTTGPIFGTIAAGSTVNYNYSISATSADTVKINNAVYHNLKLTGGLKFLKPGTTTVNGDLTFDGVNNSNGTSVGGFSTILLKGNLTMLNSVTMEDSTFNGLANRFTLTMAGAGTQTINTNGNELKLFRLQKDTATALTNLNIVVTPGSKITIGNATGGDLKLTQKVAVAGPTFTTLTLGADAQIATVRNGSIFTDANGKAGVINATNAKIIINTSTTSTTILPGTLKFTSTSSLNDLTVNITTPTKDSIFIANNILINNSLTLTKGFIAMAAGQTLELLNAATITGGSASTNSYVDGNLKIALDGGEILLFPVGQNKTFAPVEITTAFANTFTVKYNKQVYPTTTINSATTAAIPTYHISGTEHWLISQETPNSANVKFYYNNPLSGVVNATVASIAHFNGTDWDDIGRTANGTDANGTFISKTGINNFSPFTFGGANGVLPIILENFNGTLNNTTATLSWRTGCEDAGDLFELEYSTNGISFTNIYNTNAFGNCNGNIYKYIHNNSSANTNYYRLKMISANGRITFSNIVILKNGKNNFETKIVSTNNNALLGLSITSPTNGKATVQIVNAQGQRIFNNAINYNNGNQINYINTALWSNGLYFINVTTESGIKTTVSYVK